MVSTALEGTLFILFFQEIFKKTLDKEEVIC